MKLFYRELGDSGRPLIILHGLFGSSDNWLSIGKKLSDEFRVFLVDMRNHGQSPHSNEFSYHAMAGDIKELVEEHHLEGATIIGHSMGGKAAMFFACEYSEMISKLIVVDIAPRHYKVHHQEILKALNSLNLEQIKSRKEAEEKLAQKIEEPTLRQFLLKNLFWKSPEKLAWRMNLPVIENNIEEVGKALPAGYMFDKPCLFIYGEKSSYINEEDKSDIRKYFPLAEFAEIKNAGHWVHAEKPDEFLATLFKFI